MNDKYKLKVDKYETGIIINGLNDFRIKILNEGKDTEPVDLPKV